jgi:hypothetical protein
VVVHSPRICCWEAVVVQPPLYCRKGWSSCATHYSSPIVQEPPPSLTLFFFFFFLVHKIYCFDDEFLITWIFLWHVIDKGSTVVCVRHGEDNCAMFTRVAKLLDMTWYSIKKAEGSDTITDQTLRIDLISFSSNEWFDKNVKPNQGLIQYFSLKRKYTYHYHLWHIASSKYHFIIKKSLFVSCWH